MITYEVIHHIPGRIRIKVPIIKKVPIQELIDKFSFISIPEGIENIIPNPFSGSIIIKYKPEKINILNYLESLKETISKNITQ